MTNSTLDEMKLLADGKSAVPLKKFIMQLAMDIISKVSSFTLAIFLIYVKMILLIRLLLVLILQNFGQQNHWELNYQMEVT